MYQRFEHFLPSSAEPDQQPLNSRLNSEGLVTTPNNQNRPSYQPAFTQPITRRVLNKRPANVLWRFSSSLACGKLFEHHYRKVKILSACNQQSFEGNYKWAREKQGKH
ncbi:hypothetical protein SDJN02_15639, partial [Cucurbita argyrosperma subsp. argyrosperma]